MVLTELRSYSFTSRLLLPVLLLQRIELSTALSLQRFVDVLNANSNVVHNNGNLTTTELEPDYSDVEIQYIQQPLDHFNSTPLPRDISGQLYQRYFYSSRFVRTNHNNSKFKHQQHKLRQFAFLCVGGEGPALDPSVLIDSIHCTGDMLELAQYLFITQPTSSIHLYALEHRYYGQSYPTFINTTTGQTISPTNNNCLPWLSSKQAQGDLRAFVEYINTQSHVPPSIWTTFGGSYPGMMAAWARKLHPHLIHAAVSSSAPIGITLDMADYFNKVAWDLQYERIGGSPECFQIVKEGHEQLAEAILQSDQHDWIAQLFHICDNTSLQDAMNVAMWLGDGVITVPAQSNDPLGTDSTTSIAKLCEILLQHYESPIEALAAVARNQQQGDNDECLVLDWNATMEEICNTTTTTTTDGLQSWLWQTCTEFGFYQTCEKDSQCPFGRGYHPLAMDLAICEICFGITPNQVKQNVQASLLFYGGYNLNTSRILSVNGDVDPWSVLALTKTTTTLLPTHWVYGASHHYWTHPVQPWDDEEVQNARALIYQTVSSWMEEGLWMVDPLVDLEMN